MSDFKGRKDFPEVADNKIKIGDYSGSNRLAVTDIYSPKSEPELRDQMMEPVKGKTNNYDSPVLSQQPVITLSDVDAEAALIKAINGYVGKENHDNWSDVERGFGPESTKGEREEHPSRRHEKEPAPRQRYKKPRNVQAQDVQLSDIQKQTDSPSDAERGFGPESTKGPREEHPSRRHEKEPDPRQRRKAKRNVAARDVQLSDIQKKIPVAQNPFKTSADSSPPAEAAGVIPSRSGAGLAEGRAQRAAAGGAKQNTPPSSPAPTPDVNWGDAAVNRVMNPTNPSLRRLQGIEPIKTTSDPATGPAPTGFDQGKGSSGPGWGKRLLRGARGTISDVAQAGKVGLQEGIRTGKAGAYEAGPEAEERRAVRRGKREKNVLTRAAAGLARGSRIVPGMRRGAKAMGFGRTKAQEDAMRTRMEYAGDDEMMLSDILNELETYISDQQPNNAMVEQQLTRGNISKMMRNTEDKAPRDWKYHV